MLSRAEMTRAHERVLGIAVPTDDDRALRVQILQSIRDVVPFDHYAWLLTDPGTAVGSSPVADVPDLHELPRLITLKYLSLVGRWTEAGRPPVISLHAQTKGRLQESLVWRELMVRHAVTDVASVVFADRYGCWGFLDLWRCEPAKPFMPQEVEFLSGLVVHVTAALRGCQAVSFRNAGVVSTDRPGPAVILLSPALEVRAQTSETERLLRILVPPSGGADPVPAAAYNVAAQLLAVEAAVDPGPPTARVHVAAETWVTLRAARIGVEDAEVERDIAVTIEQTAPVDRIDLFARSFGLSARETEVVVNLTTGADTRQIAERMHVSEHTVPDHLKSIFAKTGCHTRRSLLSCALGR
jgi:DNA-binding CsgD family transcriptional regulator